MYNVLGVSKRFSVWFSQFQDMYVQGIDWTVVPGGTTVPNGGNGAVRVVDDFNLTTDMVKNVSMMSKTKKSQEVRNYFIAVEKEHKALMADPRMQMAMGLKSAQMMLEHKDEIIAEMKPKAIFADAVAASHTSILIGELAKLIKQNGVDIGSTRLFAWLRENGYLISRKGSEWNLPTQRSMEMGLFEIKETTIAHTDHTSISKTPKVTGKGQQYFINKFLGETKALLEV